MAGTTQYFGISYPTNTDYVKDGASAMQTIADGFDSAVAIPTYNNQTGTSYTFVLTDAGKTVTSNNASAVTFTIPPQASVAWANNTTLTVRNLGAGVVTIAGGAGVTVTNTAQTIPEYGSVRIIRTASNAWTVVPASGGASGLTLIKTQTIGTAVSSVTVTNAFSATYDNYFITLNNSTNSTGGYYFGCQLGATTTGYYWAGDAISYTGASGIANAANTSSFRVGINNTTNSLCSFFLFSPNLAKLTFMQSDFTEPATDGGRQRYGGYLANTTQYTDFTLAPSTGTFTGGIIRVYGLQNS